jgi:hypothetical protein
MVVDSFYENVERDGKNVVLHFMPRPAYQMLVACLYADWNDPQEGRLLSFAAVTDEPPPEIKQQDTTDASSICGRRMWQRGSRRRVAATTSSRRY